MGSVYLLPLPILLVTQLILLTPCPCSGGTDLLLGNYVQTSSAKDPQWLAFLKAIGIRNKMIETISSQPISAVIQAQADKTHDMKYFNELTSFGVNFVMGKETDTLCPTYEPCLFLARRDGDNKVHSVWTNKNNKSHESWTMDIVADAEGLSVSLAAKEVKAVVTYARIK